jgi:hypothetical protein
MLPLAAKQNRCESTASDDPIFLVDYAGEVGNLPPMLELIGVTQTVVAPGVNGE